MNKHVRLVAGLCLLAGGLGMAAAQDQSSGSMPPPPKVLVINTELLKPGKVGSQHEKTEIAEVQAVANAKAAGRYVALDSLAGRTRTVFLHGFDSFADMEKDAQAGQQNASLATASAADAELQEAYRTSINTYREDLSLHAGGNIAHMRYFDVTIVRVKPGHRHDFEELSKMYMHAFANTPSANWAMYEAMYGEESGGRYLLIGVMKSLAELDQQMTMDKQVMSGMSSDDMKKMSDLAAATIESDESYLFAINPKMSYPPDSWVKADSSFWSQK